MNLNVRLVRNLVQVLISVLGLMVIVVMSVAPVSAQDGTPSANPAAGVPGEPCYNGLLHVRDLEVADDLLAAGVEQAEAIAKSWESDARLFSLRLGCPLLASGLQWNGTYFSESKQAYYSTDTGLIEAAEDDPNTIVTLDLSQVSFRSVYRSLLRAGFNGDSIINPSGGVTVRLNTDAQPFGPQSAPKNAIYIHLAIEDRNEIKDVWVSTVDGTVYRYEV